MGYPPAGVIRDAGGNLYGTTPTGGLADLGIVYKLDPTGVETELYSFAGGHDGSSVVGGVVSDGAGSLYGATQNGGPNGAGVVYKVGAGGETVLYSFTGGSDGGNPYAGVIRDAEGNLYGTTEAGGGAGAGVV